jgi:hypothetical protein
MKNVLFLFSLCFLFACKKEENLPTEEVSGVVLHSISKQPLPNQTIQLTVSTKKILKVKTPEFPNGEPVWITDTYQTQTDVNGRYSFSFGVYINTAFSVRLITGNYIMFSPRNIGVLDSDDLTKARDWLRQQYDTILADRPGYIRYSIQHSTSNGSETLYVNTPYQTSSIGSTMGALHYPGYNWTFTGSTNLVKMDTIPAESAPNLTVEWLHRSSTDTIQYKKELIQVHPGSITDYAIHY